MNTLGHLSCHPPNHTRPRHLHPYDSVRQLGQRMGLELLDICVQACFSKRSSRSYPFLSCACHELCPGFHDSKREILCFCYIKQLLFSRSQINHLITVNVCAFIFMYPAPDEQQLIYSISLFAVIIIYLYTGSYPSIGTIYKYIFFTNQFQQQYLQYPSDYSIPYSYIHITYLCIYKNYLSAIYIIYLSLALISYFCVYCK